MNPERHRLTVTERERIITLYRNGHRFKEIMAITHRSCGTISALLSAAAKNGEVAPRARRVVPGMAKYCECSYDLQSDILGKNPRVRVGRGRGCAICEAAYDRYKTSLTRRKLIQEWEEAA